MSKKKSATTMTLKDFHGGSIPSDLPLPSAPGVSVKPSQEWPTAMSARSERTRHVSASPAAISPLPVPPRVIGRHFDEDERTPFNAPPRVTGAMPATTGAWAQRKEQSNPVAGSGAGVTTWSPSMVAQASAFEKVISGRWHSNSKSDPLVPPVSESEIRPTGDIGFGSGDSHASRFGMDEGVVPNGIISSENRIRSPVEQNQVLPGPGYEFDVDVPDQTGTFISSYGNVHFSGIRSVQRQAQHTFAIGDNQVRVVTDEPQVRRLGLVSEFNLPEQTHASGSFEKICHHGPGLESKQRPVARTGVIGDHRVRPQAGAVDMPGAKSEHARHIAAPPAAFSPHPVPPQVTVQHFDYNESLPCDTLPRVTAATPVVTGAWAQRREQSNPAVCSTPAGSGAGVTTWSHSRISQAKAFEKVMSGQWHSSSRSDHLILPIDESENRPVGDTGFGSGDSYASRFGMDERAIPYGSLLSENRIRSPGEQNQVLSRHSYGFDVNVPDQTGTVASGYGNVHISGSRSDQKVHRTDVIAENHIRAVADELQVKGPGTVSEIDLRDQTQPSFEESYRHISNLEAKQRPIARTGVIGDNWVRSPAGSPEIRRVGSGSGTWSEEMYGFGTNKRQYYNNWEERPRSVGLVERKDKAGLGIGSEMKEIERPASHGGVSVAMPTAQKEGTDRPRLKLLPRTKPIESQEIRVPEDKVDSELHSYTNVPVGNDLHEMDESGVRPNERPRLNLKPRSQAIGRQPEEAGGKERPSVFGNARPRELVLMERGVDLASDDIDKNVPSNRPSSSSEQTESKTEPVLTKPVNRPDNYQLQQRNIRNLNTNQKEHLHHHAKYQHHPDTQRSTWRDDTHNSTNNRKPQHQQKPCPEPDSWRKPEPVKQEDVSSPRPGKGATALELAVAFSKRSTISNGNRDSVSRNPNAVGFSRLLLGR